MIQFQKQIDFLKNYGLQVDEGRISKLNDENKVDFVKELIVAKLREKIQNIEDETSTFRKKGVDFFIEDLKLEQCKSKYKVAISNYDFEDIKKYIEKITQLEALVNEKTLALKNQAKAIEKQEQEENRINRNTNEQSNESVQVNEDKNKE